MTDNLISSRPVAERLKDAILHSELEVREGALGYFARAHSTDPTLMPQVIQAFEKYGLAAFDDYCAIQDLAQTDDTVAWLIREIERDAPDAGRRSKNYTRSLAAALRRAEVASLARHKGAIKRMHKLDDFSQDLIARRLLFAATEPEDLWQRLVCYCETRQRQILVPDQDYEYVCALVTALAGHPTHLVERVSSILEGETPAQGEWLEVCAARLAGLLHMGVAIPRLVNRLNDSSSWICEEAHGALVRIGTNDVVLALVDAYPSASEEFRFEAAALLGNIHSDLSLQASLALFKRATAAELRGALLLASLHHFAHEAMEPACAFLRQSSPSSEVQFVRSALFVAAEVLGTPLCEFEQELRAATSGVTSPSRPNNVSDRWARAPRSV